MTIERNTGELFGREQVVNFFQDTILNLGKPRYRIFSIWGEPLVGKSMLLKQLKSAANSPPFTGYCLPASVDAMRTISTSIDIMEHFARQFEARGYPLTKFTKEFMDYEKALHKGSTPNGAGDKAITEGVNNVVGAAAQLLPVPGFLTPLTKEVATFSADTVMELLGKKYADHQELQETQRQYDPLYDLTDAFVDDLDRLARNAPFPFSPFATRKRVLLLFFDAFNRLAADLTPWLLNYLLRAMDDRRKLFASEYVVLVIASRNPLTRSGMQYLESWLDYEKKGLLHAFELKPFTEQEARGYLKQHGIVEESVVKDLLKRSRGLPLYLDQLIENPQGNSAADIVEMVFASLPGEKNSAKRWLVLATSLVSRPFNQDDLMAFLSVPERPDTLSEQDIRGFYSWVVKQHFVQFRGEDGRYSYLDSMKDAFDRYLYQRSPRDYYDIRRSLATYYRQQLDSLKQEKGRGAYNTNEWIELVQALAYQFFSLRDDRSHIDGVRLMLDAYVHARQTAQVANMLRAFSADFQDKDFQDKRSLEIIQLLLQCVTADLASQEFVKAHSRLLEKAAGEPESLFPGEVLTDIYQKRGLAYLALRNYEQAVSDFSQAIALDQKDSWKYGSRALAYLLLKEYQKAVEDLDKAIQLRRNYDWAYAERAFVYRHLGNYEQAVSDLCTAIHINPQSAWAHGQRGKVHCLLKHYPQAITDLDRALALGGDNAWVYAQRGLVHLWLRETEAAKADYARSCELHPSAYNQWLIEWIGMSSVQDQGQAETPQAPISAETLERLENIAASDPTRHGALACRGVSYLLHQNYEQALAELEHALRHNPKAWDLHFWKGITCACLGRDEDALAALERSFSLGLPPVLLAPLHWLSLNRPDFYEQHIKPILALYP